jgi:hypothetical protein
MVKKEAAGHSPMSEEALKDPRHEAFARYVVEGKSHREAALLAGFSKKSASSQGSQLAKRLNIAKRIMFLQGQVAETIIDRFAKLVILGLRSRLQRIEMYAEIHDRLWRIVKERAADPAMAKIPGGQSGFMLRTLKAFGHGAHMKIIPEYAPDTALVKEIRALAQQAADELGQWKDDQQPVNASQVEFYWADPPVVEVEPVKANEDDEKQLKFPSVM